MVRKQLKLINSSLFPCHKTNRTIHSVNYTINDIIHIIFSERWNSRQLILNKLWNNGTVFKKQNQKTLTSQWRLSGMYTAWHANNNSVVQKLLHMSNITFTAVISVHHHPTNYQHFIRSLCRTCVIQIAHRLTGLCHLFLT